MLTLMVTNLQNEMNWDGGPAWDNEDDECKDLDKMNWDGGPALDDECKGE